MWLSVIPRYGIMHRAQLRGDFGIDSKSLNSAPRLERGGCQSPPFPPHLTTSSTFCLISLAFVSPSFPPLRQHKLEGKEEKPTLPTAFLLA